MDNSSSRSFWLETSTGEHINLHGLCSIGRSKSSAIPVFCERVSRRHAVLRVENGGCSLMDLGSSNGTFVNSQRVNHSVPLQPGDLIDVGSQRFTLRANVVSNASAISSTDSAPASRAKAAPPTSCWLLIGDIEHPEDGSSFARDDIYKTTINWAQMCLRVVQRYHGWLAQDSADRLCAFWPDPHSSDAITRSVADALRELRSVQQRQYTQFRLALHLGEIDLIPRPAQREGQVKGPIVEFTKAMERHVWMLDLPVLISEAAAFRLSPALAVRRLEPGAFPSSESAQQFYSL